MADVTMKLSREGDDVFGAKDYRLNFNAQWPIMQPLFSGSIPAGTLDNTTIVEHKLGYKPFFFLWKKADQFGVKPPLTTGPVCFPNNDANSEPIMVDSQKMYIPDNVNGSFGLAKDYYYTIFNLSLEDRFVAPNFNTGKTADNRSQELEFGFKIAQKGNVKSTDSRDFTVNSEFQPLLVHSVTQHEQSVEGRVNTIVPHNLGYAPMFYVFGRRYSEPASGYRLFEFAPESSIGAFASADDKEFRISIFTTLTFTVVLLKDPIA